MMVASFVIGAGQSVLEFSAQTQAANEQNRYYEENRQNALRSFENQQNQSVLRQSQENEAAAQQKFDASLENRRAQATAKVAAGEAGVSGLSVEAIQRDIASGAARYGDRVDQQTEWTQAQLQAQKAGQSYQAVDRINSVRKANKPSFLATGLKIAASGVNAYSGYRTATRGQ